MPKTLDYTYDELVEKAQHMFWMKGYKSVKPEELAEELGVSVSTIYNKYTKEKLFLDSLNKYVVSLSDPILTQLRESNGGMKDLKDFYYNLICCLLDKTFPRSCLMVNTVVELRNENAKVTDVYQRYFEGMRSSYREVIKVAIEKGEIKYPEKRNEYIELLMGVIISLSILYKTRSEKELKDYIDGQLAMIE